MKVTDANFILRYLLKDDIEQYDRTVLEIESKEDILLPEEIIAEIVYVLQKVYKVPRNTIANKIINLISYNNIILKNYNIIEKALNIYSSSNLDYADCVVYSYGKLENCEILTFDRELQKKFNIDE